MIFIKIYNVEIILSVFLIYEGSNKILFFVGDWVISFILCINRGGDCLIIWFFYFEYLRDMVLNVGLIFGKDFC